MLCRNLLWVRCIVQFIYYTNTCICIENRGMNLIYFNVRTHKRESKTQELAAGKKSGCLCNRLILHQGLSGTYLSQQGKAVEGWGLEPLDPSGAQSGTGTPKMDDWREGEWGAKREKANQRAGRENGSEGEESEEDGGKRRWAMAGQSFFWSIIEWCSIQCVDWDHLGDSGGRLCVCLLALEGEGLHPSMDGCQPRSPSH